MASDHHRHPVPGAGSDGPLPDDAESLDALRRVWLASDHGSDSDAILAATEPMGPAQQEQIVQRLLRSSLARPRAVLDERADERSEQVERTPLPGRLASLLHGTPLWSVAAACALCCWLTARAPVGGNAWGREAPHAPHRATEAEGRQRPTFSSSTSRGSRVTTSAAKPASSARAGDGHADLAETHAKQQRFEEAEALRAFAIDPPFAVF